LHKTLWTFFLVGTPWTQYLVVAAFFYYVQALQAAKSNSPDKELDLNTEQAPLSFTANRAALLAEAFSSASSLLGGSG
jgi:hypothetical protein